MLMDGLMDTSYFGMNDSRDTFYYRHCDRIEYSFPNALRITPKFDSLQG